MLLDILLIVADDIGREDLAPFATTADVAVTPRIDAMAAEGLTYTRAYVNPTCSPTRYTILTGHYAARDGVGIAVKPGTEFDLPLGRETLFEALGARGYSTAAFGKWHLEGDELNLNSPNEHGADTYRAGSMYGPGGGYKDWERVDDGVQTQSTAYNTSAIGNAAINWWSSTPSPRFAYVAFNAAHAPFHVPPLAHQYSGVPVSQEPFLSERTKFLLMMESLDMQVGRLLDEVGPETLVLFVSDNGTPKQVTSAALNQNKQKGTAFDGGVRVPMIAWGAGVLPGECQSLVSSVDIFDTLACCGVNDSKSFRPTFQDHAYKPRSFVYGERFNPDPASTLDIRYAVGRRYKVIRDGCGWEAYDLVADPGELVNVWDPTTPALLSLRAVIDRVAGFCWEPQYQ